MENSMEVPQKIKTRTTIRSSNSIPGHISEETKTLIPKDICTLMFIAALFTVAKMWKQPKCPISRWMDKEGVVYIHTQEYYSTIKKNENLPFATTWMDLEGIMLSEISQRKTWYHLYVKSKKQNKWMNITKQTQTHRHGEKTNGY